MNDEEIFRQMNEDLMDATRFAFAVLFNPYREARRAIFGFDSALKSAVPERDEFVMRVIDAPFDNVVDGTCKVIEHKVAEIENGGGKG